MDILRLYSSIFKSIIIFIGFCGLIIWYLLLGHTNNFGSCYHNIIQSAFGSLLFFGFVFIFLKPSIVISSNISSSPENVGSNVNALRIKIINTSLFKITDLSVSLFKVIPVVRSGKHKKYELIMRRESWEI